MVKSLLVLNRMMFLVLVLFVFSCFSLTHRNVNAAVVQNVGYLSISPTTGSAGTIISVHGYGFQSYESGMVFIDYNGNGTWDRITEPYANTPSSIGGSFTSSMTVKSVGPGSYSVRYSGTSTVSPVIFTVPGEVSFTTTVDEITDQSTSVTGTAEERSEITVYAGKMLLGLSEARPDRTFNVPIPVQPAGKVITVTITDFYNGNIYLTKELIVKDITPPITPTINKVTDQSTSVTGTAEIDSKVEVKIDGSIVGSSKTSTDGNFNIIIPKQKAGTKLLVSATDNEGNVSEPKEIIVEDGTAPAIPQVDEVTDLSPTITGTAEAASIITVKTGAGVLGTATAKVDGRFSVEIPMQNAGTKVLITATDQAGNVSDSREVIVKDIIAPRRPVVDEVSDQTMVVNGEAEAGSLVEIKVGRTVIGSQAAGDDEKFHVSIPKQAPGVELAVTSIDNAGNISEAVKVLVKDATAPGKPVVGEVTDKDTSVSGQAEAGSNVEAKVSGAVIGSGTAGSDGKFTVTIPVQKAGTKLVVSAVDKAGNVSEGSVVTVKDMTGPGKPIVGDLTDHESVVAGNAESKVTVIAKVSGVEVGRGVSDGNGVFSITIPKQTAGAIVEVFAVDSSGNVSESVKLTVKAKLVSLVGDTRYATGVKVSQTGWSTADTVLLVNGFAIVDGLTATPLATAMDAPILLTAADSIPQPTMDELIRLKAKQIVLIGGEGVITPKIERELVAKGFNVTRIGGLNRKDTSLLIAKKLDQLVDVHTIYVAYGWGEPDALSIAALAGLKKQPIILADKDSVPAETLSWLSREGLTDAHFIGGEGVVAPRIIVQVDQITSGDVRGNRLSGLNRHETNAKVMAKFYPEGELKGILLAKSETVSLVDALAAGPLAAKLGSPVLLVSSSGNGLLPAQQQVLAGKNLKYIYQIGGGVNREALGEVVNK